MMYRNPPSQLFFQFTIIMRGRWDWLRLIYNSFELQRSILLFLLLIHDSWYTFVTMSNASKQMKFVLSGISAALWVPRLNIISPNLWQPIRIEKELIIMLKYPFFCCNIKKTCIAVGHVSETLHSSFSIVGDCQSTTFTTVAGFCGECAQLFCLVKIYFCLIDFFEERTCIW